MKITVITSSRADYGLLKPLIRRLHEDDFFKLSIIATGTHLSAEFGNTYREIEQDGFRISARLPILQAEDSALAITKTCSAAIEQFGEAFHKMKPDVILVLGDRYEILCGVFAALFFRIPVIHYSGGEKTEGAYDDAIRHAITKMSHLHFVSSEEYKNRVLQLGEQPGSVFNVGSLGVDNIRNTKLLSRSAFEKSIDFKLADMNILVSYHPETLSRLSAKQQLTQVLKALDQFKDCNVIFTKSNADNDGRVVSKMIDDYVKTHKNCIAFESLGLLRYLSAIRHCDLVLGNSSSGLTEVPSFNKPTVNIGDRQKGRVLAESVINAPVDSAQIIKAIKKGLSEKFKAGLKKHVSPFGNGTASLQMVRLIKTYDFTHVIRKSFRDIKS